MSRADQTLLRQVGRRVHSERLEWGWQSAVARALAMSTSHLSEVMKGNRKLNQKLRQRAEQALEAGR